MKTLIIMFKEYNKNIVFRDCQMHIFWILDWEEMRSFWFSSVILLNANSAWEIGRLHVACLFNTFFRYS